MDEVILEGGCVCQVEGQLTAVCGVESTGAAKVAGCIQVSAHELTHLESADFWDQVHQKGRLDVPSSFSL